MPQSNDLQRLRQSATDEQEATEQNYEKSSHNRPMMNQAEPDLKHLRSASGAKHLLVVYHSVTGATEQMAHAVVRGAASETAIETRLLRASVAAPDDVLWADGYVFATPECLAAMAGVMKDFFDRCYYPVLDCLNGRPYAALICAGSDGQNAARQIERIATGWRLRAIAPALIVCTNAQTPEAILAPKQIATKDLMRGEELGATLAAGLTGGIF